VVALVGGQLPRVGSGLGVVKGRRALGQPGLGRVQRRLRLPGSRLSRPHPGVVHGKAGDPLTVGLLDNLLGEVGHPRRGCLVS